MALALSRPRNMAGSSVSVVSLADLGEGVVRASTATAAEVGVAEVAAVSMTSDSGTAGCGRSTVACAGGGLSLLLLLEDADGEDEKVENPGMVMAERRLLRTLRLRARPLRDAGVSEFDVAGAAVVLWVLESWAVGPAGAWLDEVENPGMPIADNRFERGRRVLRLRAGAGGAGSLLLLEVG